MISEINGGIPLGSGFDFLRSEGQKSDEAEQDQDFFHAGTLDDRRDRPAFGTMIRVGRNGRFPSSSTVRREVV
jgi:hypothetical protein